MFSRVVKSPHYFYLILSYFILFIYSLIGQSIRSPITHRQSARHVIRRSLVGASASPRSTGNEAGDPVVLEFPEGKEVDGRPTTGAAHARSPLLVFRVLLLRLSRWMGRGTVMITGSVHFIILVPTIDDNYSEHISLVQISRASLISFIKIK